MSTSNRRRAARRRTVVAVAALIVGTAIALPQTSGAVAPTEADHQVKRPKIIKVSGDQIPVDLDNGEWRMTGGLIGSWTVTASTYYYVSKTRVYQKGVETFAGCVNLNHNRTCETWEPTGTWQAEFVAWASLRSRPENVLIDGDCVHPTVGGSGAFRGVRGIVVMDDDPVGNTTDVTTEYVGEVILNAVPGEPEIFPPAAAERRAASTTSTRVTAC